MKNILIIGCGHMGGALLSSWATLDQYSITVIDNLKHNLIKKKYKNKKIKSFKNFSYLKKTNNFDFIILAVRPSDSQNVLKELAHMQFKKNISLVSVVAGKKINFYKKNLKNIKYFFRVMPNMPAAIGESMNCITANLNVTNKIKKEVIKLFSYSGKTLFFPTEKEIDMATAISGSGPGFIFKLIDSMEKAAIKLGFKKSIAQILVMQTFKGSIKFLSKENLSAMELVNLVATKGGTTEAGLNILKLNKIDQIFTKLTKASYNKAKDQSK